MPAVAIPLAYYAAAAVVTAIAAQYAWQQSGAAEKTAKAVDNMIANMSSAEEEAQAKEKAGTTTFTCATCKDNPCAHLACGTPGAKYRGGAHGCMTGTDATKNDGLDSHHTPAAAASPLPRAVGPAIQMDPEDHWMTASNGRVPGSAGFIAAQRGMINSGNFLGASAMDVADIRAKFGNKYDGAIAQMEAYTACLKKNGAIA